MNHQSFTISGFFLERCKNIVLDNLDNNALDVSFLAKKMGMSRASLYRKLKAYSGISSSAFIKKVKLEKAMDLLLTSKENISSIALESGFHSVAYFDTCFREHFGYSPSRARKSNNNVEGRQVEIEEKNNHGEDLNNKISSPNQLHHFPEPYTSFIGRQKEIEEITSLLENIAWFPL